MATNCPTAFGTLSLQITIGYPAAFFDLRTTACSFFDLILTSNTKAALAFLQKKTRAEARVSFKR